ncbi:MAG: NAD(P)/FAD-dependent oxidoreductase, partial [Chloroflexota bacterium]|nr:NAD(P)/FAD-dependent oxidoreductase [Chloroflexota bacterium]
MYDLIVIGGGPAGLTATIYAIRKRLNVLLVSKDLGGKTNYNLALPWVEDYERKGFSTIRGLEIVDKFRRELEYLDFARHMEAVDLVKTNGEGFTVLTRGGAELPARSVIVATGANQELLRVPGEKEFMMRGMCYSALSYSPLFIDRTVIVIGEGELAQRSAAELAIIAKHVYVVCECDEVMDTLLANKLQSAENVTILNGYKVVEIKGDNFARSVLLQGPDGDETELEADGTFIEKALTPLARMVEDMVDLDEQGRIIVDSA